MEKRKSPENTKRAKWAQTKIDRLMELRAEGTPFPIIAKELGTTKRACIGMHARQKLGKPPMREQLPAPPKDDKPIPVKAEPKPKEEQYKVNVFGVTRIRNREKNLAHEADRKARMWMFQVGLTFGTHYKCASKSELCWLRETAEQDEALSQRVRSLVLARCDALLAGQHVD